jgi:hypothetical protein
MLVMLCGVGVLVGTHTHTHIHPYTFTYIQTNINNTPHTHTHTHTHTGFLLEASKEITTTGNEAMSKGTGKALVTSAPVLIRPTHSTKFTQLLIVEILALRILLTTCILLLMNFV